MISLFGTLIVGCSQIEPTDSGLNTETTESTSTCIESVSGTFDNNVEWVTFDGNSNSLFSLADNLLASEWVGQYGTYDLNSNGIEGGNGFKLSRPGRILGAQVVWANIGDF